MISIDFWNTLVKAETGGEARREVRIRALKKVAGGHREQLTEPEIARAKQNASEEFDRIWFNEQRTPTTDELVQSILDQLGIPATANEKHFLVEAFEESLWEGPPELAPGVREVLPELAERYPLAIISDTMYSPGRIIRKYLEREGILNYFRCFVFSDETGYSKPNPKAYRQVLRSTGCDAALSWHIGDLLETDIDGARKVGMKSILFTGFTRSQTSGTGIEADYTCSSWEEVAELLYDSGR